MKYPRYEPEQLCYVPKAKLDHTISGQGTSISTLDHSATTQRVIIIESVLDMMVTEPFWLTLCNMLGSLDL